MHCGSATHRRFHVISNSLRKKYLPAVLALLVAPFVTAADGGSCSIHIDADLNETRGTVVSDDDDSIRCTLDGERTSGDCAASGGQTLRAIPGACSYFSHWQVDYWDKIVTTSQNP